MAMRSDTATPAVGGTATPTVMETASPCGTRCPFSGLPCLARGFISNDADMVVNSGAWVDSYHSSLGVYGGANVEAHGDLQAADDIIVNGLSEVHGDLDRTEPAGLCPVPTPVHYIDLGELNIHGSYTFQAGDYVVDTINCNGTPSIRVHGGQVRIWFNNLNLAGSVGLDAERPSDLILFSRSTARQVNINGSSNFFTGVIFAPNIPVTLSGSGSYFGACVASRLVLNSSIGMHYDEDLGVGCRAAFGGLKSARDRSAGKGGGGRYVLPLGKNLVAYPNPARVRMTVVFRLDRPGHLKLGLADLVGRTVGLRDLGLQDAGVNGLEWDLGKEAPGIYLLWATLDCGEGPQKLGLFKVAVVK